MAAAPPPLAAGLVSTSATQQVIVQCGRSLVSADAGPTDKTKHESADSLDRIESEQAPHWALFRWQLGLFRSPITQVACGEGHALFLTEVVWSCGNNEEFQLGRIAQAIDAQRLLPVDLPSKLKGTIVDLAAGAEHSAFVTASGQLITWGGNDYGQLGRGTKCKPVPAIVKGKQVFTRVAAGNYHSAALTDVGTLYTWGEAEAGKLGQNTDDDVATPKPAVLPNTWSRGLAVACTANSTTVLDDAGRLWSCGDNSEGQAGHPRQQAQVSQLTEMEILPTKGIATPTVFTHVACGESHVVALTNEGHAWTCGSSRYGMLGHRKLLDDVFALRRLSPLQEASLSARLIAAGSSTTLIIVDAPLPTPPPRKPVLTEKPVQSSINVPPTAVASQGVAPAPRSPRKWTDGSSDEEDPPSGDESKTLAPGTIVGGVPQSQVQPRAQRRRRPPSTTDASAPPRQIAVVGAATGPAPTVAAALQPVADAPPADSTDADESLAPISPRGSGRLSTARQNRRQARLAHGSALPPIRGAPAGVGVAWADPHPGLTPSETPVLPVGSDRCVLRSVPALSREMGWWACWYTPHTGVVQT
ncbi:uncharacterized protein MONBRDRAFT_13013 [Monosiga brevicollis MX1]|uniref:RCC1-like domain-containing protein n=1 Tax=Monosiga brevicollis TaxID=81824 RepID=A9VE13_MONBE|nr:uncharacterized protein MONBRDRAFT_13013 [Monosiga brevicollis MX1]EDQ84243.1 predicted protein [Monosiga brevicollis MX1]|eukprot:XP_001750967.1 hypothetical protein [Monosiga brevicollis MX1]